MKSKKIILFLLIPSLLIVGCNEQTTGNRPGASSTSSEMESSSSEEDSSEPVIEEKDYAEKEIKIYFKFLISHSSPPITVVCIEISLALKFPPPKFWRKFQF